MPEYPPFPFVVRHIKLNCLGVAIKTKMVRTYPYFSVSCIQDHNGGHLPSTWAAWSQGIVVVVPDLTPESLGWKPRVKVDMYLRNSLTGAVARAYSDTFQNRVPAWRVEKPDGSRTSRWLKKYSVEITKEEYDAADKTIVAPSKKTGALHPKKKMTGKERKCKDCGEPITNGNWWYCGPCHSKRLAKVAYRDSLYVNSGYPADVSPFVRSEI